MTFQIAIGSGLQHPDHQVLHFEEQCQAVYSIMLLHHKKITQRSSYMPENPSFAMQTVHIARRLLFLVLSAWIFGVCSSSKNPMTSSNCSASSIASLSSAFHPCHKSSASSSSGTAPVDGVDIDAPESPSPREVLREIESCPRTSTRL